MASSTCTMLRQIALSNASSAFKEVGMTLERMTGFIRTVFNSKNGSQTLFCSQKTVTGSVSM